VARLTFGVLPVLYAASNASVSATMPPSRAVVLLATGLTTNRASVVNAAASIAATANEYARGRPTTTVPQAGPSTTSKTTSDMAIPTAAASSQASGSAPAKSRTKRTTPEAPRT
jgi:hypothetical protein